MTEVPQEWRKRYELNRLRERVMGQEFADELLREMEIKKELANRAAEEVAELQRQRREDLKEIRRLESEALDAQIANSLETRLKDVDGDWFELVRGDDSEQIEEFLVSGQRPLESYPNTKGNE